jgi:MerR family transcriptional regulator, light-induced transcriptional regulator
MLMSSMAAGGLNIAALAKRTGVAPDTLRKWEQRYGILRPTRTEGGQRRYSELDVARVEWLCARLADGYRIGEAASLLGAEGGETARTPAEFREALVAAARDADAVALARKLDQAFALFPLEEALPEIVEPLLRYVGDAWERGDLTVAQEHLVSEAVRARIERLLSDVRGGPRGVAVLACAPGERHDLGLLMLAVLLQADGWQVAYLGADTPLADALALAGGLSARMLCVSVTMPDRLAELEAALRDSPRPELEIVLGGAGASAKRARAYATRYVDTSLTHAVKALRRLAA